jgi:peptide/nickel transport system substrate-binding protein
VTQVASFTELSAAQAGGKYNLIADNFSDTDPDILRSFYSSGALDNLSKVQDAQLDRLLEQAASTLSASAREALYAQAEKRIADLALVIPVRDYVNLNMTRSPVKDLHFDYAGWFPILIDVSK